MKKQISILMISMVLFSLAFSSQRAFAQNKKTIYYYVSFMPDGKDQVVYYTEVKSFQMPENDNERYDEQYIKDQFNDYSKLKLDRSSFNKCYVYTDENSSKLSNQRKDQMTGDKNKGYEIKVIYSFSYIRED